MFQRFLKAKMSFLNQAILMLYNGFLIIMTLFAKSNQANLPKNPKFTAFYLGFMVVP
jgi:hypothetical protein